MFAAENSGLVGGVGLIITALGFVVTLWALGLTYQQLLKTKNSVDSANEATAELRRRLAGQNAVVQAAYAETQLKTAQRELRANNWPAALDAIDALRELLLLLNRRADHISVDLREELIPLLKDLSDFGAYLEKPRETIPDAQRTKMAKSFRNLSNVVTNIRAHLEENS